VNGRNLPFIKLCSKNRGEMKNKKTAVYEKIKRRIIEGTLAPGLAINENEFAQILKVSKTPVREALRELEIEGFVESIPGRGSAVSHISFQDIREIFELREIIECGAVKRAVMLCDLDEVQVKKKALEQFHGKSHEAKISVWGPEEDVHQFIVKCINNRKLHETYSGLLNHIIRIRKQFGGRFTRKRYDEILVEHIEILDALIEGNAERAEKAVQIHLRNAGAYLLGLT
jgi:DNA-binding GntR family transcriptional regulator